MSGDLVNGIRPNFLNDLRALCKEARVSEALQCLPRMDLHGAQMHSGVYAPLLLACTKTKSLTVGRQIHAHIITSEFSPSIYLLNSLINMYAKCGSMVSARQLFDQLLTHRNLCTWSIMISGYYQQNDANAAIELFEEMKDCGFQPNAVTYVSVLGSCSSVQALELGKYIHACLVKDALENVYLGNSLVNMYAKCGSIYDAFQVFDLMPYQDTVSWTAMISACAKYGSGKQALLLYSQMQSHGFKPNKVTCICLLSSCRLEWGKKLHACLSQSRLEADVVLSSSLIGMYIKCGSVEDACSLFDRVGSMSIVMWNSIISGCAHQGDCHKAIELFSDMQLHGLKPNRITYLSALSACADAGVLGWAQNLHANLKRDGLALDLDLGSTLVTVYSECGSINDAFQVFNLISMRDAVSWTTMISGYAEHGHNKEAIELFAEMQLTGLRPDGITFIGVLSSCSYAGLMDEGYHYFETMNQEC